MERERRRGTREIGSEEGEGRELFFEEGEGRELVLLLSGFRKVLCCVKFFFFNIMLM